jgi:hypothetical protein
MMALVLGDAGPLVHERERLAEIREGERLLNVVILDGRPTGQLRGEPLQLLSLEGRPPAPARSSCLQDSQHQIRSFGPLSDQDYRVLAAGRSPRDEHRDNLLVPEPVANLGPKRSWSLLPLRHMLQLALKALRVLGITTSAIFKLRATLRSGVLVVPVDNPAYR